MLMDLYNRGNSHTGYYLRQNGRDMLALAFVPTMPVLLLSE